MSNRQSTNLLITEQQLIDDPCVSFWLKQEIENTRQRDLIDALRDAELLAEVLLFRLTELSCKPNAVC